VTRAPPARPSTTDNVTARRPGLVPYPAGVRGMLQTAVRYGCRPPTAGQSAQASGRGAPSHTTEPSTRPGALVSRAEHATRCARPGDIPGRRPAHVGPSRPLRPSARVPRRAGGSPPATEHSRARDLAPSRAERSTRPDAPASNAPHTAAPPTTSLHDGPTWCHTRPASGACCKTAVRYSCRPPTAGQSAQASGAGRPQPQQSWAPDSARSQSGSTEPRRAREHCGAGDPSAREQATPRTPQRRRQRHCTTARSGDIPGRCPARAANSRPLRPPAANSGSECRGERGGSPPATEQSRARDPAPSRAEWEHRTRRAREHCGARDPARSRAERSTRFGALTSRA
jgi:hypothetical protein